MWLVCATLVCGLGAGVSDGAGAAERADLLDESAVDSQNILNELGVETRLMFYVSFDGTTEGVTPHYRIGSVARNPWFENILIQPRFEAGWVGQAAVCDGDYASYPAGEVLNRERGTLALGFKLNASVTNGLDNAQLLNGVLMPAPALLRRFNDGQWHLWTVSWDARRRMRTMTCDGKTVDEQKMPARFEESVLVIGRNFPGRVDELYIFNGILDDKRLAEAVQRGNAGQPCFAEAASLKPAQSCYPVALISTGAIRPALPPGVDWSLHESGKTATRRRFDLSGYWRVQPFGVWTVGPPALPDSPLHAAARAEWKSAGSEMEALQPSPGQWAYSRFPGSWRSGNSDASALLSAENLKTMPQWDGVEVRQYPAAWIERDFELPGAFSSNRIFLVINGVHDETDVYVNDRCLGQVLPWERREYDITACLKPGSVNRVSMLCGKPYLPPKYTDKFGKVIWLPSGPCLPLSIEERSGGVWMEHAEPTPSFRKKNLQVEATMTNSLKEPVRLEAAVTVRDVKSGDSIKLPSQPITLRAQGEERVTLTVPWENPICWTPDEPRMLELVMTLRNDNGTVDEAFPIRFGFREIGIAGADFTMNGHVMRLRGNNHGFSGDLFGGDRKRLEGHFDMLKEMGFNASIAYFENFTDIEAALDIADEKGVMVFLHFWPPGDSPAGRDYMNDRLLRFRRHPAVVLYILGQGYNGGPHGHPVSLGRTPTPDELKLGEYRASRAQVEFIHSLDPTRPVAFYLRGIAGDFRSIMHYFTFGTPVQSKEEWFRYWAEQKPCPFLAIETSMTYYKDFSLWQRANNPGSVEPCPTEHAARYLGNTAYRQENPDIVRMIEKRRGGSRNAEPADVSMSPNFAALYVLTWRNCVRSWRTYGASYGLHSVAAWGLKIPGWIMTKEQGLNLIGETLRQNNSPILAYIAGGDDFVRKDHAFFASEKIGKQAALVNDTFHPLTAKIRIKAALAGRELLNRAENINVPAGERKMVPFEFTAPDVQERSAGHIELSLEADGKTMTDEFAFEVFPKQKPLQMEKAGVKLLDRTGETAEILQKAGVPFEKMKDGADGMVGLNARGLLVIGRKSYDPTVAGALMKQAEAGLNILCFEQTNSIVFGLRNDDPNTRHAFISAADHPVISGLEDPDFRNWRGQSDLLEAYPDYRTGAGYGLLDMYAGKGFFGQNEFAQWSANGTVANFHFEKPQTGCFKAILSSGFDLLYTPLVELNPGRGRIMLCSLDVTDRYGKDPVATRVVNRLLEYAATPVQPRYSVKVWGAPSWKTMLDTVRIASQPMADPGQTADAKIALIGFRVPGPLSQDRKTTPAMSAGLDVDQQKTDDTKLDAKLGDLMSDDGGSTPVSDELRKMLGELEKNRSAFSNFLNAGGALVIPCVESADWLRWLPVSFGLEKKEIWRGGSNDCPALAGLTDADFFFRRVLTLPVIASAPKDALIQNGGLTAVVPVGKGKIIFCQITPDYFSDPWQKTKALRMLAMILSNAGAAALSVGDLATDKDMEKLWYAAPALDFNPDEHRQW